VYNFFQADGTIATGTTRVRAVEVAAVTEGGGEDSEGAGEGAGPAWATDSRGAETGAATAETPTTGTAETGTAETGTAETEVRWRVALT
jgi:hypothetical protein